MAMFGDVQRLSIDLKSRNILDKTLFCRLGNFIRVERHHVEHGSPLSWLQAKRRHEDAVIADIELCLD